MLHISTIRTHIYIIVVLFITSISCGPSKGYLAGASTYEDEEQMWNPAYRTYHISDEVTRFYFIIPPGDILYVRNPKTLEFEASAEIEYQIIKPENSTNRTIERGVVKIERIEKKIPDNAIIGYFDVNIPDGSFYYANIVLDDKLRKHQFQDLLTIDKKNKGSKENFIITDSINSVMFLDYVDSSTKVKISSERIKASTFIITRYLPISDYPIPIYVERNTPRAKVTRDTTYTINSDEYITLDKAGIYFVQNDTSKTIGLTILNFYEGFPLVSQRSNMAPPMRYITSDDEFNELSIGTTASKLETEKIWASMSNDLPKTEKQLTTYYKRVQFANVYFTSYKEGWRTDRGLVYTIFGPPSNIYKSPKEEKWVYGIDNPILDFEFSFRKISNPLTSNDFILLRDDRKKEIWKKAVEHWRKGKVFDEKEIIRIQEEMARQRDNRNNYWAPSYYRGY
jgi:GWxTD domain-containing protein